MKTQPLYQAVKPRGIPHLRWGVAGMLFLAAILNYVDRQTLSLLAPTIQSDLKLTERHYKWIVNFFIWAYTISLLLSGRLVDRIGTRLSMALFVGWWSIANIFTALARGFWSLGICRFSLGLGEAGNWPASAKVVSEWFNAKERAFTIGFYTLGATVGATIAPILVNTTAGRWGWQFPFVAAGVMGLAWVVPWVLLYRRPEEHPRITPEEMAKIKEVAEAVQVEPPPPPGETELQRWGQALSRREVWGLMLGRLLSDPVWYFYQFWFAKYLFSARGVSQQGLTVTTFVYLAADVGCLLGGLASGLLIKRHVTTVRARVLVMLGCALLMPLSVCVPFVHSLYAVIGLGMVAVFTHLAWLANISALVVDVMPKRLLATCFGIVAAGSAVGALFMNEIVGALAEKKMYHPWFFVMGGLHPIALVIVYVSTRKSGRSAA